MPFAQTHAWQFLLTTLGGTVIADISSSVLEPRLSPRLSVPSLYTWPVALAPALFAGGTPDGLPLFANGLRRGVTLLDGMPVQNAKLWRVKPAGDPTKGYAALEFISPMVRWATRYAQDVNGQIFDGPSSDGSDRGLDLPAGIVANPNMTVAAGEMLRQALANTIANDGDLECTLGGPFSATPSPGGNVAFAMRNLSPLRIAELATLFREAGAVDIVETPLGPGSSAGVSVSAVNRAGTDLPGIAFDYATGAHNVAYAYPESDMDDFANKIWFELGQREGSHFRNNVTEDAPGVTVDSAGSRALFGVYHDIPLHPVWSGAIPTASNLFKMYVKRYNAELEARMVPRERVRIVPQAGLAPEPWLDYNLGDTPRMNLAQLGIDVSGASFRVIGWDTTVMRSGAAHTEPLIGWAPE